MPKPTNEMRITGYLLGPSGQKEGKTFKANSTTIAMDLALKAENVEIALAKLVEEKTVTRLPPEKNPNYALSNAAKTAKRWEDEKLTAGRTVEYTEAK